MANHEPPPNMPFPVSEHIQRTTTLSVAEHGALRLLYDAYWLNNGPLDDDDEVLARLTRTMNVAEDNDTVHCEKYERWPVLRKSVVGYFRVSQGKWHCSWIDSLLQKVWAKRHKQKTAATSTNFKRWRAQKQGQASTSTSNGSDSLSDSLMLAPEQWDSLQAEFDQFWEAWPNHFRKSDRNRTFQTFARVRAKDGIPLVVILSAVGRWKLSKSWQENNGQFIPAPKVWLNGARWEVFQDLGGGKVQESIPSGPAIRINGRAYGLGIGPVRSEFPTEEAFNAAYKSWLLWKSRH